MPHPIRSKLKLPMLKKIPVEQLTLGMHLHALCGPWLSHPFWRTKFVMRELKDLAAVRASVVRECWIDTGKGLQLEPQHAQDRPPDGAAAPSSCAIEPLQPDVPEVRRSTTQEQEFEHASLLCGQLKQTVIDLVGQVRMGKTLDVESSLPLMDEVTASIQRNAGALVGMVRLKTHDDYSYMHSVAVCTLMVALALKMGQSEAQAREAGLAGLLHDMGKARIARNILNKPGKLTDLEYQVMKGHPRIGRNLLEESGVHSDIALDVCLHHHERPDGKGYPDALSGEALSLQARMGAICDVYDAITSNRPYKDPWGPAESISLMAEWTKAGQFDAVVFRKFVDCVGIYPNGSLVRLQSERLAVVTEQNPLSLVAPSVKVFYSLRSKMPVSVEVLELGAPGCRDRIVARESNRQWRFPFLDELAIPRGTSSVRKAA